MQASEYVNEVLRTLDNPSKAKASLGMHIACMTLGLTGEAGEVADIIKKHIWHDHPLDREALKKELGDVLWYLVAISELYGISLDEVMQSNIAKLRKRYPDGFDVNKSINR